MSEHPLFYTDPDTGIRYRWNKLTLSWDEAPQGGPHMGCGSALSALVFVGICLWVFIDWLF